MIRILDAKWKKLDTARAQRWRFAGGRVSAHHIREPIWLRPCWADLPRFTTVPTWPCRELQAQHSGRTSSEYPCCGYGAAGFGSPLSEHLLPPQTLSSAGVCARVLAERARAFSARIA